mgnify:FL=1
MKTSLDIPENELKDAMRFTKSNSKREAIVRAIADFNRRQRLKALAHKLGTFEGFSSHEELQALREAEIAE